LGGSTEDKEVFNLSDVCEFLFQLCHSAMTTGQVAALLPTHARRYHCAPVQLKFWRSFIYYHQRWAGGPESSGGKAGHRKSAVPIRAPIQAFREQPTETLSVKQLRLYLAEIRQRTQRKAAAQFKGATKGKTTPTPSRAHPVPAKEKLASPYATGSPRRVATTPARPPQTPDGAASHRSGLAATPSRSKGSEIAMPDETIPG
jgi:hypothetical protein